MARLDLLVARNSSFSRREAANLFRAGRVRTTDGERLTAKQRLSAEQLPAEITLNGDPLVLRDRYDLLLHKPLGVVTAHEDSRHPTAYALLRSAPLFSELRAVGRLDKQTSGLLMWTTDGTLLHRITHPRYGIARTYHVALDRRFAQLPPRVVLDDGWAPRILELTRRAPSSLHVALDRPAHARDFASVTITSGRTHEVRRIFAALGATVVGLARVRFGSVVLPPTLEPGEFVPYPLRTAFGGASPRVAS